MRFKLPDKKIKVRPKFGETRLMTKFLIFPKYIDREIRWLCVASYQEKYIKCKYIGISYYLPGWEGKKWIG